MPPELSTRRMSSTLSGPNIAAQAAMDNAAGLLLAVSWLVWRTRRQCPCLLVGWLWFLGTLVPVIGLVQVGSAARRLDPDNF